MRNTETHGISPYPVYKATGASWLGEVPGHWETERLKQHVNDVNEQTRERLPSDVYIALENVESWTGKITGAEDDVSFDSQVKRFQAGDVLFGKLRPYLAKVTAPNKAGLCVGEFLVLRCHQGQLSPEFLELLMRSKQVIDAVDASTFGAKMPRANWDFIGNMLSPVPPLDEQAAIVRYLDDADQRIRAYVSAKERLIALLEEERQAVIHQAVTRGLDPNVKLKPSGVEWLGDVPEHWEVRDSRTIQADLRQTRESGQYTGHELIERPCTTGQRSDNPVIQEDSGTLTRPFKWSGRRKDFTLTETSCDVLMFPKWNHREEISATIGLCGMRGVLPSPRSLCTAFQNHVFAFRPNSYNGPDEVEWPELLDRRPALPPPLLGYAKRQLYFRATAKATGYPPGGRTENRTTSYRLWGNSPLPCPP